MWRPSSTGGDGDNDHDDDDGDDEEEEDAEPQSPRSQAGGKPSFPIKRILIVFCNCIRLFIHSKDIYCASPMFQVPF